VIDCRRYIIGFKRVSQKFGAQFHHFKGFSGEILPSIEKDRSGAVYSFIFAS